MSDLIEAFKHAQGLMIVPLVLLMGLLGSSHCLFMCVPIASGLSKDVIPYYHLGKLLAYFMVGGLIFYFSQVFLQSEVLKVVAGLVFLSYFVFSLFKDINHKTCVSLHKKSSPAFVLGLLNGLLPCAWLYLVLLNLSLQVEVVAFFILVLIFWLSTLPIYQVLKMKSLSLRWLPLFKNKLARLGLMVLLTLGSFALHYPTKSVALDSSNDLLHCFGGSVFKNTK